jgi:hypothetical protein
VAESWHETAGVNVEKGLGLLVGIDFDVLVRDLFVFESWTNGLE